MCIVTYYVQACFKNYISLDNNKNFRVPRSYLQYVKSSCCYHANYIIPMILETNTKEVTGGTVSSSPAADSR